LSKLPPDSSTLDIFDILRRDNDLSDEEAFLKFIKTYDVSLGTLNQIATTQLPASFSSVKYREIAPYYLWLDPGANGRDIQSRMPLGIFQELLI
jgi:hypothetical protein